MACTLHKVPSDDRRPNGAFRKLPILTGYSAARAPPTLGIILTTVAEKTWAVADAGYHAKAVGKLHSQAMSAAVPSSDLQSAETPLPQGAVTVGGMNCASCVAHVDKAIRSLPGVAGVNVNLARGRASVTYDAGRVSLDRIAAAATDAGYPSAPITHDHSPGAQAHDESRHAEEHAAEWRRRAITGVALWLPAESLHWISSLAGWHPHGITWMTWFAFVTSTLAIVLVGDGFYRSAIAAARRRTTNMDTLVAMGASVAYAYSLVALVGALLHAWALPDHLYFTEASALLALVSVGHWMETRARDRAGAAIRQLLELAPETALRLSPIRSSKSRLVSLGVLQPTSAPTASDPDEVPVSQLVVGDRVLVKPGMRIPIDGIVETGTSSVDESMLTGEPLPATRTIGHEVAGGTLNRDGALVIRVVRVGAETALSQIVQLVEEAQNAKPAVQRLADRVSAIFVPIVLLISVVVGAGWLAWGYSHQWPSATTWGVVANNVCSVLIIACPCALGIALPAALMVSTGWGAQKGILVRSLESLQRAEKTRIVVLDKTGTITRGTPEVAEILPDDGIFERELLYLAGSAEMLSEHPLAVAIAQHARASGVELHVPEDFRNEPGIGVHAKVGGRQLFVGREIAADGASAGGVGVFQINAGGARQRLGTITLRDSIRDDSRAAIATLRNLGCEVVMLTGDHAANAQQVAGQVGIRRVIAGVRPDGKARAIAHLKTELRAGESIAMIGDGINDAPALAAADLGIAVGSGADVAKQSAGIVLVGSSLRGAAEAIALSRVTMRKVRQNLFWAFFYNVVAIPAAAFGYLNPTISAGAMALSDVTVIGNALLIRHAMRRVMARAGGDVPASGSMSNMANAPPEHHPVDLAPFQVT